MPEPRLLSRRSLNCHSTSGMALQTYLAVRRWRTNFPLQVQAGRLGIVDPAGSTQSPCNVSVPYPSCTILVQPSQIQSGGVPCTLQDLMYVSFGFTFEHLDVRAFAEGQFSTGIKARGGKHRLCILWRPLMASSSSCRDRPARPTFCRISGLDFGSTSGTRYVPRLG